MSSLALADDISVLYIRDQIPHQSHRRTRLKGLKDENILPNGIKQRENITNNSLEVNETQFTFIRHQHLNSFMNARLTLLPSLDCKQTIEAT